MQTLLPKSVLTRFYGPQCSVALYAAETWTLTQTDRRRLEAFGGMWIWRIMEKISWLDKITDKGSSQESKRRQTNKEFYLAKETSMGWPCFET